MINKILPGILKFFNHQHSYGQTTIVEFVAVQTLIFASYPYWYSRNILLHAVLYIPERDKFFRFFGQFLLHQQA
ncbi:MAG: hypothetical protein C5B52_13055 [Bacteroidetes bacterium]|nr:MAG: hypothetical protein C5B52_13055 [Bacteroidota bacterium]